MAWGIERNVLTATANEAIASYDNVFSNRILVTKITAEATGAVTAAQQPILTASGTKIWESDGLAADGDKDEIDFGEGRWFDDITLTNVTNSTVRVFFA